MGGLWSSSVSGSASSSSSGDNMVAGKGGEVVDNERRRRHDELLVGYRTPSDKWQHIDEKFATNTIHDLVLADECIVVASIADLSPTRALNVTILLNRPNHIGPQSTTKSNTTEDGKKTKLNEKEWPSVWKEFISAGFLSIICESKQGLEEFCFRKSKSKQTTDFWFWHISRSPTKPTQTPIQIPTQSTNTIQTLPNLTPTQQPTNRAPTVIPSLQPKSTAITTPIESISKEPVVQPNDEDVKNDECKLDPVTDSMNDKKAGRGRRRKHSETVEGESKPARTRSRSTSKKRVKLETTSDVL